MNSTTPSLPSLRHLPYYAVIDGMIGYLCGKLSQTNPKLTALIFAIRCLANTLFYHIANYLLQKKGLESQKVFLITSTFINMTFLIVLRDLNILGKLSSWLVGVAILGYLVGRVRYIQNQERQLISEQLSE